MRIDFNKGQGLSSKPQSIQENIFLFVDEIIFEGLQLSFFLPPQQTPPYRHQKVIPQRNTWFSSCLSTEYCLGFLEHRFKDGVSVKYHIPDICMIWYTMWPDMPMICNTDVSLMFGRNNYSLAKYHYNKYHYYIVKIRAPIGSVRFGNWQNRNRNRFSVR